MAIQFTTPSSPNHLQQILDLQQQNLPDAISAEKLVKEGFVTVQHSLPLLEEMNRAAPQVIAKDGELVAGYALVMLKEFQDKVPVLKPMFTMLEQLEYRQRPLPETPYYVMGQICIAEAYRGRGLFEGLYKKHRELYSGRFQLCITEVAARNPRSLRAHQKTGFRTIHTFTDATDTWEIVAWDWS